MGGTHPIAALYKATWVAAKTAVAACTALMGD